MRITRFLLPGFVVALGVGPASAQPYGGNPAYAGLVPSVRPVGAEEPGLPVPSMPPGRTPGAITSLEQMGAPIGQPGAPGTDPVGTLTGQPTQPGHPPGSYPSPYYTDGPGCCGPLGRDGRIGYELYSYAGLNFTLGSGLPDRLNATGWTVGGGVRTLYFDASHTAAWTVDFGGSYSYNRGRGDQDPVRLFLRTQPTQAQNGAIQVQPDRLVLSGVRGLSRSSFNFALGRDIWLLGDGSTGGMNASGATNWRIGGWVGGRYGTSHIDVNPLNEVNGYARRQNVFEGVYVGVHTTFDVPFGSWVWTNGVRAEYGYDWTNIVPPLQGNLHNINIQFTTGFRF